MNVHPFKGKRVARLIQQPAITTAGEQVQHLCAVVFEDGSRITFGVAELFADYAVTGHYWPVETLQKVTR